MRSTSPDTSARRRFIAVSLVDSIGQGIYVPLTMLFVQALTGQSLTSIGTGLTIAGLGALASMPAIGVLIDRFGGKRVYIGALALRATGFALYLLATTYPAFLAVALLIAVAMWASSPSQQSLIGDMARGDERDRLLACDRSLRNGGMGFGGLAAAALLAFGGGYLTATAVLAAACVAAAILASRISVRRNAPAAPRDARGGYREVLADRPYLRITVANFLIAFGYTAQAIALPVFLTRDVGIPDALAGTVFALNTALVAVFGVPVARAMHRARRARGAALGTVVFALAFAAFGLLPALGSGLAAAAAVVAITFVYTAGELIHSAPAQSLSVQAARDHIRGRYLSVYQLSWSLCRTVAPLALGLLLDAGTWQLWAVLALSVLTGGLILVRTERHLPAHAAGGPARESVPVPA